MHRSTYKSNRRGAVYIIVLGTALIVSMMAISAIALQRIQNRILSASADIRQAQLNADTAIELGLLEMNQNSSWRSSNSNGSWFSGRGTGNGTCSLTVVDPLDADLADSADEPIVVTGTGLSGQALQRLAVVVHPLRMPHDNLRENDTSQPDWSAVVAHYQSLGTAININSLGPPQLARNGGLASATLSPYWTGDVTGIADDAAIQRIDLGGGTYCLRIYNREGPNAGAAQKLSPLLKAPKTYTATIRVWNPDSNADKFRLAFYADPSSGGAPITYGSWGPNQSFFSFWQTLTLQFTTPNWTEGQLANAIVIVQSQNRNDDFYTDDLSVTEDTTDKYIYRQVLSANTNPYGSTDANGIYYIDCGGTQTLVIERSRIVGTLVVINPGSNSRIGDGPIHWMPAKPGYPTILVSGNFSIWSTNTNLSESTNATNYNPSSTPYYGASTTTDAIWDDTYSVTEAIQGLVGVSGNLSYQNSPRITGRVIAGGAVSGTPLFTYRPDSLLSPPPEFYDYSYVLRPTSAQKTVVP